MRLDVYLVEKGLFTTRNKAQSAIKDNAISINGKIVSKPNYDVSEFDEVTIVKESNPYVSRGGFKLEKAIKENPALEKYSGAVNFLMTATARRAQGEQAP